MPRAAVDPEELRTFVAELKRFNNAVQAEIVSAQRQWSKLGASWQDQEHEKFAGLFERLLGTHARLLDASEKNIPLLLRKAQRIQDYLGPQASGMGRSAAEINSPDTIKEFRTAFLKFEEVSKQAVAGVRSDCGKVMQWVRYDQLQYWKLEMKKSEELLLQAKSAYAMARYGAEPLRKNTYVDEEKALRKAQRRKEEAERKLEAVRKWTLALEQQALKLMGPINNFSGSLDSTAPLARSRLDQMILCLEEYLRESPAEVGVS